MSTEQPTLAAFAEPGGADDGAEPAWTPRGDASRGRCATCQAHVPASVIRVVGTDGSVPVCGQCYESRNGRTYGSTVSAVRHYRAEQDTAATDAVRKGVGL